MALGIYIYKILIYPTFYLLEGYYNLRQLSHVWCECASGGQTWDLEEQGLGFRVSWLTDSLNDAMETEFYYQSPTRKIMT